MVAVRLRKSPRIEHHDRGGAMQTGWASPWNSAKKYAGAADVGVGEGGSVE